MDIFAPVESGTLKFHDLEDRYGSDHALAILRTLECEVGVREDLIEYQTLEERMATVFATMLHAQDSLIKH